MRLQKVTFSNTKAVQIRSQKYTYSQMKKDMQELEQKYSNYCEMTKIGTSVQGRAIYDFAIGNPDAEESLLVVSTPACQRVYLFGRSDEGTGVLSGKL